MENGEETRLRHQVLGTLPPLSFLLGMEQGTFSLGLEKFLPRFLRTQGPLWGYSLGSISRGGLSGYGFPAF